MDYYFLYISGHYYAYNKDEDTFTFSFSSFSVTSVTFNIRKAIEYDVIFLQDDVVVETFANLNDETFLHPVGGLSVNIVQIDVTPGKTRNGGEKIVALSDLYITGCTTPAPTTGEYVTHTVAFNNPTTALATSVSLNCIGRGN